MRLLFFDSTRIHSRWRRVLRRALVAGLVGIIALSGVLMVWGREVARGVVHMALDRAGLAPGDLDVRSIRVGGMTLGVTHLGDSDGPSASAVEVEWTLGSLMQRRLTRLRLEGVRVNAILSHGAIEIVGLSRAPNSSGAAALPIDLLELVDAQVTLATDSGKIRTTIGATITETEDGLGGVANLDITESPLTGNATHLVASLPTWRLTREGSGSRLTVAQALLEAPDLQAKLSVVEGSVEITTTGEITSAHLTGALTSQSRPVAWPAFALEAQIRREEAVLVLTGHAQLVNHAIAVTLSGRHDLVSGQGSISATLAPVSFTPDGRQPATLFPAFGHILRQVAGSVSARASASWGSAHAATAMTLHLDRIGFNSGIAEVSELRAQVELDSVLPPHTPRPQHITAQLRLASLPQGALDLRLNLPGGGKLEIERASLAFAGGSLGLSKLDLQRGRPVETALEIHAVELGSLLDLIGVTGLSGSGKLSGRIPIEIDGSGVTIKDGALAAESGGIVRYTGAALPETGTAALELVRKALADFHYTALLMRLNRSLGGDGSLLIELKGANPAVLDGQEFDVNVRLETNFDRLVTVLQQGYAAAGALVEGAARQ